jgi:copper homeostasis protein
MAGSKSTKMPVEVAVFSGQSALKAQSQGASRVELNAPGSYAVGGITPPISELKAVADQLEIATRVMIRPRGAPADGSPDFIYSSEEVEEMVRCIKEFKATGLLNPLRGDGFVFGLLQPTETVDPLTGEADVVTIDREACQTLIETAKPFGCVFHRAFDPIAATKRVSEGISTLLFLGFEGVLTAGGRGGCEDNIDRIDHECHKYAGRIQFVIGGGLRTSNIQRVASQFSNYEQGSVWMHTAALTDRPDYPKEEIDSNELIGMLAGLDSVSVH